MKLTEKKVLVVGTGISGIAATKLLVENNNEVILYDGNEETKKSAVEERLGNVNNTTIVIGNLADEIADTIDIAVVSPGVPMDSPLVLYLNEKNIPVIGEIELAYVLGKGTVIGITGTNGKTTTTALTGAIMKDYFDSTFVVGNIGIPYTNVVDELRDDSVIVAEISSFQLETTDEFHPHVTAILNVTPDHLNRHHTMENYTKAKSDITKRQTKDEYCVLNYDNDITRELGGVIPSTPFYFSTKEKLEFGIYYDNGTIYYSHDGKCEKICETKELILPGMHNVENVMAAVAMAIAMEVPMENIKRVITTFKAVEHRIEFVEEIDGVVYYNDSKGTNTDAAIKGIEAMDRPTVLLAGGYDKQSEYDEWIQTCVGRVKCLVLIGQTREKIKETAEKYNIPNIILADTFEEAMDVCVKNSQPGDAVLLSPACASWGMFKNYEQRGDMFKEYVRTKIKQNKN